MDSIVISRPAKSSLHPIHAILLAFVFPLFLGTLFSDLAYWRSYEIQWSNFSQWLNVGGLLFGGLAVIAALASVIRHRGPARGRALLYFAVLVAAWCAGMFNALVHSQDGWAIIPAALWWSGISAALALIASWLGFAGFPIKEDR